MILSYLKVNLYFKLVSNNAILQKNLEDGYDFKSSGINKVLKFIFLNYSLFMAFTKLICSVAIIQ